MYALFLALHSFFRWLVLISLLYTMLSSLQGLISKRPYNKRDNLARTLTGAIAHTQLLIGFTLYFLLSPVVKHFIQNGSGGEYQIWFFGLYHIALMFIAVVVMTIGGSLAKRAPTDRAKFKTTLIYFSVALALILLAIPWFRPYFRNF